MTPLEFYAFTLLTLAAVNGIQVLGLNIQYGVAGIMNFGYIILVAVGAYATGIAAMPPPSKLLPYQYIGGFNWPFPWDLLFGVAAAVVFGLLLAGIAFSRIAHWYLAVTFFAISYGMQALLGEYIPLFNGTVGLVGIPGPWQDTLTPGDYQVVFLLIAVVAFGIVFALFWQIERAPLGRALRALREDDLAARALAKNSFTLKTVAFLLGSAAAGLGGGLTALYLGSWSPDAWLPGETFILFAAVIVGGRGWTVGAFVGSLIIYDLIIEGARFIPEIGGRVDLVPTVEGLVLGLGLLAFLWWRPRGVFPEPKQRFKSDAATALSVSTTGQSSRE